MKFNLLQKCGFNLLRDVVDMLVLFNVSISLEFSYPRIKLRASDWSSADKANVEKSKRLSADKNSSYSQIIATTFEHVVDTGLKLTITSFLIRICCLFYCSGLF